MAKKKEASTVARVLSPGKETIKVLLVEDIRAFLDLEKSLLARKGFAISTAASGAEALKILYQTKPDLVLLDLYIPEVDGFEILKWIRSRKKMKHTRVIVLSSSDREEDIQRCRDLGCNEYLTKPITSQALYESVVRVLQVPPRRDTRIPLSVDVVGEWEDRKFIGRTRNVSTGGLYVETDSAFPPGSAFSLRFPLPDQKEVIAVVGRLLRSEKLLRDRGTTLYGLAFQFVSPGTRELELLKEFVSQSAAKDPRKK